MGTITNLSQKICIKFTFSYYSDFAYRGHYDTSCKTSHGIRTLLRDDRVEQGPDKRRREVVAEGQGVEICHEWQRYGGRCQETSGGRESSNCMAAGGLHGWRVLK